MRPSQNPRPLTEILSEEHALMQRAFAAFARYAGRVGRGAAFDPRLAREFLRFFRDFGDRRHHVEEERLLFAWLEGHGLPGNAAPLVVLRHEHELERDLRLGLALAADALRESPGDSAEQARFHDLALRFVELNLAHMAKEEGGLFPLADQLAQAAGGPVRYTSELPARELEWVAHIEVLAKDWPAVGLTLREHGTPQGFERLCDEALARA